MGIVRPAGNNVGNAVVVFIYALWLLFVFALIAFASILSYRSGHLSWLNLLWLILILSPRITIGNRNRTT